MNKFRARLSTGAAAAAMAFVLPQLAQAQDRPAAGEANEEGETIVVTGARPIAESEAAALLVQKNSDSLVAVAAADSVGRLPDQNIAQAIGRLPGVAVERDQGQARYISLRGSPNYWTTLSFDGINVSAPRAATRGSTRCPRRSPRWLS
jgi:outer membrane receptor for ferrienterochelin and colicin